MESYTIKPGYDPPEFNCIHYGRTIVEENDAWIDPHATGDDSMWRETCDSRDTFTAEHEVSA
jgi:hypothetical protein